MHGQTCIYLIFARQHHKAALRLRLRGLWGEQGDMDCMDEPAYILYCASSQCNALSSDALNNVPWMYLYMY